MPTTQLFIKEFEMKNLNLFKKSLKLLSILTILVILLSSFYSDEAALTNLINTKPYLSILYGALALTWILLILILSTVLLLSEQKRAEAFLIVSKTKTRDELEEKAVNDAIKRTFIFNLALLSFILSFSGFFTGTYKKENNELGRHFGYALFSSAQEKSPLEQIKEIKKNLTPTNSDKLKKLGIHIPPDLKLLEEKNSYLIPQSIFSPYGVLWLIILQFLSFKLFLFLNLRALNSED